MSHAGIQFGYGQFLHAIFKLVAERLHLDVEDVLALKPHDRYVRVETTRGLHWLFGTGLPELLDGRVERPPADR